MEGRIIEPNTFLFEPIAFVRSSKKERYSTKQQGVLEEGGESIIEFVPGKNFEQAIKDLQGFERIWVIFLFHLNDSWKPKVNPPRVLDKKISLFATRSPHRPNRTGLSCVKLLKIEKLNLFITESDILDGSPVIDIKPYLPYCDSFPEAKTGWHKQDKNKFTVIIPPEIIVKFEWLKQTKSLDLSGYIIKQLEFEPNNTIRKRIKKMTDNDFELSYRLWKIKYQVNEELNSVLIQDIYNDFENESGSKQNLESNELTYYIEFNGKFSHRKF